MNAEGFDEEDIPPTPKGMNQVTVIMSSRVVMLTFGGKQAFTAKAGEVFPFDLIVEENESFIVGQTGLNFYVLEAQDCVLVRGKEVHP